MTRRLLVLSACLLAGATLAARASNAEQVPLREPLAKMSRQIGPWIGRDEPQLTSDIVAVLGVDEYINRAYGDPSGRIPAPVSLYVGYYKSQREGDTIHSPLNCIDTWQLATSLFAITLSTTDCAYACLSVCDIVRGSLTIGVFQFTWYAGTGHSCTSRFFAIELAFATVTAMPVMRLSSSSVTIGLLANPQTPL